MGRGLAIACLGAALVGCAGPQRAATAPLELLPVPATAAVGAFALMRTEVSNAQFAAFVAATGYVTDAERDGVGHVWMGRWSLVRRADWRHPHGPRSSVDDRGDHPVVMVSQRDGAAFCAHHGLRLPSDAEWTVAVRGSDSHRYLWGNRPPRAPWIHRLGNLGRLRPCCAADDRDGHLLTAPVGSYPAGAGPFGHLDLLGNVWEWTTTPARNPDGKVIIRGAGWGNSDTAVAATLRHANPPRRALNMVGVRCASGAPTRARIAP
jgi:formylglycine-generating enzyme required for sulfatase activity